MLARLNVGRLTAALVQLALARTLKLSGIHWFGINIIIWLGSNHIYFDLFMVLKMSAHLLIILLRHYLHLLRDHSLTISGCLNSDFVRHLVN